MKRNDVRTTPGRTGFERSSTFWRDFARRYWNQRPVHLTKPFKQPFITVQQLFEGITHISDVFRRGSNNFPLRFYVRDMDKVHFLDLVPVRDDRSLDGYVDRMRARLQSQPFGLVINDYHAGDELAWRRARDFLRELFNAVGIPPGKASVDIFFGSYDVTPFGLHKDFQHVFTWILKDRKRILTWPFETFSHLPGVPPSALTKQVVVRSANLHDYSAARDSALVLEGNAGDLLYWPPSNWHVAESRGAEAPVTISIGITDFADPITEIQAIIQQHADYIESEGGCWFPLTLSGAAKLPRAYSQRLKWFNALSKGNSLVSKLKAGWLARLTGLGLGQIPSIDAPSTPIFPHDILVGDAKYPIRWAVDKENLMYSANGWTWEVPNDRGLLKLIRSLNRAVPTSARKLREEFAPVIGQHNLRIILENLVRCRWLETRGVRPLPR
jgi:50S ribosomal protein L16 3-hydroxylase